MENNDSHLLRSIFFDQSDIFYLLFDKRLNIIDANQAALKLFKLPLSEIIGKNIAEVSPDVKAEGRFEVYMEVIRTGKSIIIEEAKLHSSYGDIYSRLEAFKVNDGMGLTAVNITDLVNVVEEIDGFIYRSSQDMRSPIASILGLASIAKNNVNEPDTLLNYLKMIKAEALKLDGTLQMLLKVARLHHNTRSICMINFNLLFNNVIHSLSFAEGFDHMRFNIQNSSRTEFYSEINFMATIFQNILDNAIKYRKLDIKDSFVNINIEDSRSGVSITVTDNGIGISEEQLPNIFKMFQRGTNQGSGAGLGLYTVKHHINSLKGFITVSSEEHQGSRFEIYLPNIKP